MKKLIAFILVFCAVLSLCACSDSAEPKDSGITIPQIEIAYGATLTTTLAENGYLFNGEGDYGAPVISGKTNNKKNITEITLTFEADPEIVSDKSALIGLMEEVDQNNSAASLTGYELDTLGCLLDTNTLCELFSEQVEMDTALTILSSQQTEQIGDWSVSATIDGENESVTVTAKYVPQ